MGRNPRLYWGSDFCSDLGVSCFHSMELDCFMDGKMVVYKGDDLPIVVLENEPYNKSLESYKNEEPCRFTTAANLIKNYKGNSDKESIDYSFKILEQVALSAEWSVVYDIKNMQIHFSTQTNRNIRIVDINAFDFSCKSDPLVYELANNHSGNINKLFEKLNDKKNLDILQEAITLNAVYLEDSQLHRFLKYFKECKCEK